MDPADYQAQARGDVAAYERYLAGMDASMRQKVALTAAHLLCEGRVADMGMGSGQGSHALAALYPRLDVIGVDIDATMVALAQRQYEAPNLSFLAGDIAHPLFPAGSLDGIFDSSVLHHVTSFGGYRHDNAADALSAQVAQLKPHGVLVVRDFLDPGPAPVLFDVPADDGDDSSDPRRCSTAALLERFAREFRSLAPRPGCPLERVEVAVRAPALRPGRRRYRVTHKHAVEFALRKDYRADWESEIKEEYTYFTQDQFEALFARSACASSPPRRSAILGSSVIASRDASPRRPRRAPARRPRDQLRHGFSTSGRVRAIEARQLLRAAQVGGLPDARLELNVYDLLHRLAQPRGPWIGEELRLKTAAAGVPPSRIDSLLGGGRRRAFERTSESAGFLRLESQSFEELDAKGRVLREQPLEYVTPVPLGTSTVAVALLAKVGAEVLLGVDEDDLPAAQGFSGNSNLPVTPAWRLPRDIQDVAGVRAWVAKRIADEYGVDTGDTWELGGPYRPSPGLTPETVFPLAVEVVGVHEGKHPLAWVPLQALVERRADLHDGYLRVMVLRASHALGPARGAPPPA
jgi:SAM-dependent methyltransferase